MGHSKELNDVSDGFICSHKLIAYSSHCLFEYLIDKVYQSSITHRGLFALTTHTTTTRRREPDQLLRSSILKNREIRSAQVFLNGLSHSCSALEVI